MSDYAVVSETSIARHYDVPLIDITETANYKFWLQRIDDRLSLCQSLDNRLKPLSLDFSAGQYKYRLQGVKEQRQPLARACGLTKGRLPAVVDATAGLAQDGLILAALGSEVTLIEQHPLIHALLNDALSRAHQGPLWLQAIVSRIRLVYGNAIDWLGAHQTEVIYLDPMYPRGGHDKGGQVKKGMQLLRLLPGTVTDHEVLFAAALQSCQSRLVVKRPDWADTLSNRAPDTCYHSKTHHYDIYLRPL